MLSSSSRRRVAVQVALGQAHGADVEARAEVGCRQLGRAAADVEEQRSGVERADSAQRQLGLFVAGEQTRPEAVRPLDLAEERLAVLGVANRARRDGERALRAELLELAPKLGERVPYTCDRERQEAPSRVDALAEARDDASPDELVDVAVGDVGDQEPRRVRAQIDGGDARHFFGITRRSPATVLRTSATAACRTRSWASEACSLAVAAVSRSVPSERASALVSVNSAVAVTTASAVGRQCR